MGSERCPEKQTTSLYIIHFSIAVHADVYAILKHEQRSSTGTSFIFPRPLLLSLAS